MRRKLMLASAALAAAGLFGFNKIRQASEAGETFNTKSIPTADARLGVNLSGIADWGTEFPFVDLFKQSRAWFVEGKEPEDSGLTIDADGWVTQLPNDVEASTIISVLGNDHFPRGDYVILYDGEGEIKLPNHFTHSDKPGRLEVHVDGKKGIFLLSITKTNPDNYIRNIRAVAKAYEKTHQQERWNPSFLKRWSGVACLRFMDYGQTNNSTVANWERRAKPTDTSFATNGVPVEWLVDLANRLNCDAWFCMPHLADDDYIIQHAQYVAQHLKPSLRAWVEYSNEVWNGSFDQYTYATKTGLSLKLTDNDWEAASKFYAHRSVQIFNLWEQTFGGTQRLVRVLASQASYSEVAEQILSFKLPNKQRAVDYADVLAIANYVHLSVSSDSEPNGKVVAGWSLDQLFDHLNKKALPESKSWLVGNKKIADAYGLKLVAYEAGQHVVAYGESADNNKLTQLFNKANGDARMGDVYTQSLAMWQQVGGDLICSFDSVGGWSKWGSWGLLQHHDDAPTAKFKAVMDWAKSRGQKVSY
ncbi:MAG: hypothetical protein ACKE5M_00915 [Methylophilaceae bacterium]